GIATLNTGTVRADLVEISEELDRLPPWVALTGRQTALLRTRLKPLAAIVTGARKIADMPEGRFAFNTSPHVFEVMPHVDNATITIWLLQNDARLCAQDGDF